MTDMTPTTTNIEPYFVLCCYPCGMQTVSLEGTDDPDIDGETLLTFTQFGGVEKGMSEIFATIGEAEYTVFRATYAEQKAYFDDWAKRAEQNDRPQLYRDQGIAAVVALGPETCPQLPEPDGAGSRQVNEDAKRASAITRQLLSEIEATRPVTLRDVDDVVSAVAKACGDLH